MESDLLHIYNIVCISFDTLEKGNSWSSACFHLLFSPGMLPEQKNRPSKMWAVFFLSTACWSCLPSLLGSRTNFFVLLCVQYIPSRPDWESGDVGALGKAASKEK